MLGRGGRGNAILLGRLDVELVHVKSVPIALGDVLEALAEDGAFHGWGAVEAPLTGGDAENDVLFDVAHGLEAVAELFEQVEEGGGVFVDDQVLAGAQAVAEAVAAGSGFALGSAGSGGFGGISAIGVEARVADIWHVDCYLRFEARRWGGGDGGVGVGRGLKTGEKEIWRGGYREEGGGAANRAKTFRAHPRWRQVFMRRPRRP